ncbi:MAG: prevent-host-death protein [bacterium]|nr:prevent-host-death protein [bacterium]
MITVSQGRLKTNMQEYFRKVAQSGEELIVTKHNIPILKIVPLKKKRDVKEVFADIRGAVKYSGDLLKPETEEWGELC